MFVLEKDEVERDFGHKSLVRTFLGLAVVKRLAVVGIQVSSRVNRKVDGAVLDVALVLLGEELLGGLDAVALARLALARGVAAFTDTGFVCHSVLGSLSTRA